MVFQQKLFGKSYVIVKITTDAGNPKWAKWAHLAPLGSQLECKVCFTLPTRGSSWTFFVFSIEVVFQD